MRDAHLTDDVQHVHDALILGDAIAFHHDRHIRPSTYLFLVSHFMNYEQPQPESEAEVFIRPLRGRGVDTEVRCTVSKIGAEDEEIVRLFPQQFFGERKSASRFFFEGQLIEEQSPELIEAWVKEIHVLTSLQNNHAMLSFNVQRYKASQ